MPTIDPPETVMKPAAEKPSTASGAPKTLPVEPIPRGFIGHFCYGLGMFLTRVFTRFETRGEAFVPDQAPYVVAANHETYVDGMWIGALLPRKHFSAYCALVGADLMTEHGLFGRIICRVAHGIPIDRKANPVRGLILAKKQVEAGHILLVHPEGTRTPDGRIGPLQEGAAFLAYKAGVPLLPIYIDGGYQLFNRHWKWPKPFLKGRFLKRKRVILKAGQPLYPADFANAKAMTAALKTWFEQQQAQREITAM